MASPVPSKTVKVYDVQYNEDVHCIMCKAVVVKPVEVQLCKLLACESCCIELMSTKPSFDCPGCSMKHSYSIESFSSISPLVKKVLSDLSVQCDKCHRLVRLASMNDDCSSSTHQSLSHPKATIEDIIQQPLEAEPTILERKAATSLVSRLLHQQRDGTISLRSCKYNDLSVITYM